MINIKRTKKTLSLIAVLSVLLFIVTQLIINSNLNPLGAKLEKLNREKNLLIEYNRQLQEELSYTKSVTVVSEIAEKKLNLTSESNSNMLYISDPTYANKISQ